ncbi:MAG TPA: PadR family transcriptional regulator [Aggregatilineales bacterium]|nr:PadR family transcriptional regulator [Aggregatilineales bacterium]
MGNPHDRRKGRRERRDFWRAWREEQRRFWHDQKDRAWGPDALPPHEIARAWREFFHDYMGDWPEGHWIFGGRRFSPWQQGLDSFNPFVASVLSKGGGLLPLYMLHLVSQKPRYGNEITEIIATRTGGQWVSNPGAIYPLLTELEQQGLIEGIWEDPQKRTIRIYSLTKAGEQELARLKSIVNPKLREAIEVFQWLMDDLDNGDQTADMPDDDSPPNVV